MSIASTPNGRKRHRIDGPAGFPAADGSYSLESEQYTPSGPAAEDPADEGSVLERIHRRLSAPFAADELKTRKGPRGDLRYITARTARRRLDDVLGPYNWSCRVEPGDKWVKCALTIILPNAQTVTREAVGGYPDMSSMEDSVKGGDSDAFKRACVLFGIGEYLYGDEPEDRVPMRREERPEPARREPAERREPQPVEIPQFTNGRGFYRWVADNGYFKLADEIGKRFGHPQRMVDWGMGQIDAAVVEILRQVAPAA